ncbi:fatty acid metabolism transcriptional regulator FadR [Desulfothermus okinawensis JCM 13304]
MQDRQDREVKRNEKYEKILEAAIKTFSKYGYYRATISQIAKEAGVADGTIYLYFKNKDDILRSFFNYRTNEVFAKFKDEVKKGKNALDKLRRLIHAHLSAFENSREMAIVYQVESKKRSHLSKDKIKEMSNMYMELVKEIIELGQKEGTIRKDLSIPLVRQLMVGAIDEVITSWVYTSKKYSLSSMADPLMDLIVKGIGNDKEK